MSKSSFVPVSFTRGYQYNERTERFLGVDLTTPQLQVDHSHGVYSKNYVAKQNGKVETRFGYEELVGGESNLRGLWFFVDGNGQERCVGVKKTFVLNNPTCIVGISEYEYDKSRALLHSIGTALMLYFQGRNTDCYAVSAAGKLWILTGDYFVVVYADENGDLHAEKVSEWEGTFIPTVTYAGIAKNVATPPDNTFVTLDYPNLMSKWRRDVFITGLELKTGEHFPKFRLETKVGNVKSIKIEFDVGDTESEYLEANLYELTKDVESTIASADPNYNKGQVLERVLKAGVKVFSFFNNVDDLALDENPKHQLTSFDNDGTALIAPSYTSQYLIMNVRLDGAIVPLEDGGYELWFFTNPTPNVLGKPNLEVIYQWASDQEAEENASFVDHCTLGTLFGANNSLNRLWLAGNPDEPNWAIHSDEPNRSFDEEATPTDGDFSYIPDFGKTKFGEKSSAIIGMVALTSDKMMVLKNRFSNERTMFFVTPVTKTDSYGVERETYATAMSNTSTAGLTPQTVVNFNGDTLFLSSDRQIVGLDIQGIVGDSQRVASTRSYYIDKALANADLSNARLFTWGNYLCLCTKEATFFTRFGSLNENKQYQWWPCDPIPNEVKGVAKDPDGDVILLTSGEAIRFREPPAGYPYAEDIRRIEATADYGSAVIAEDGSIVMAQVFAIRLPTFSSNVAEDDLWLFEFYEKQAVDENLYYKLTASDISDAFALVGTHGEKPLYFTVDQGLIQSLHDGKRVLVIDGNDEYVFDTVSIIDVDEVSSSVLSQYGYAGVYFTLNNETDEMYGIVPKGELFAFKGDGYGEVDLYRKDGVGSFTKVELYHPSQTTTQVSLWFENRRKITPEFRTIRLAKSHVGFDKFIDNVTISNDSESPSELYVGVLTNKSLSMKEANGVLDPGVGFGFDTVRLESTDFDKNAVPKQYNLKRFPRLQQSFTICFTAKTKRNSVLSGIDILYRVRIARNKR